VIDRNSSNRRCVPRPPALLLAAGTLLIAAATSALAADVPSIRMVPPGDRRAAFEVVGADPAALEALSRRPPGPDEWPAIFAVATVATDAAGAGDRPNMLGKYEVGPGTLRFRPRFPLEPGVVYRASFDPTRIPGLARVEAKGGTSSTSVAAEFVLPRKDEAPTTRVAAVYPTRDLLPENQLKLYLHFSAPMGRGGAYGHVHLRGPDGKDLEIPLLELAEELWDPSGTRLTLLFDPGRIKTGLRPREELGPILVRGKSYAFVVDRDWPDAEGRPLAEGFRKAFRAGPPDDTCPDPATWALDVPTAGTRDPLTVTSPEPLDRALFERVVAVLGADGRPLAGEVAIDAGETRWRFTPQEPWRAGEYRVSASRDLEDLAGNRIGRPFEVDVFEKVERSTTSGSATVPFRIGPAGR
jgi:hypothetical protein